MPLSYAALRQELTQDPLVRGYAGMSGAAAATSLNTANRPVAAQPALLSPSTILNAIVAADLAALTQLQTTQLSLALSGAVVDVTTGTTVRAAIQALFAGKATTLARLGSLVAPYDSPPPITRAAEIGWPSDVPLTAAEVTYARALP